MDMENMQSVIGSLSSARVLIVGDVMLDHYTKGEVERISPEAPVPVVRVTSEEHVLGGGGNVARNIQTLGGVAELLGVLGDDREADQVVELCADSGFATTFVRDTTRPTTRKTRVLAQRQQIVRIDRELAEPIESTTLDKVLEALDAKIADYEVVIVSDYGKGVVCPRFMEGFHQVLQRAARRPLVLVDPKTQNYDLYTGVDLLTPNTKETSEGAGFLAKDKAGVIKAGLALFKRLRCKNLLVTLGADGMALFQGPGQVLHIPTFARKVFDVTGAGDTVIATVALALAAGADLATACVLANYAAGIVVGQVGAATVTPVQLNEAIDELPKPLISTWLNH